MKEDIEKFFEKLKNESDRGVVLISEELINNYLTSLFEKYLILNKDL
jgi:vacuolar-type H+-ATPase subunit F/Vma7